MAGISTHSNVNRDIKDIVKIIIETDEILDSNANEGNSESFDLDMEIKSEFECDDNSIDITENAIKVEPEDHNSYDQDLECIEAYKTEAIIKEEILPKCGTNEELFKKEISDYYSQAYSREEQMSSGKKTLMSEKIDKPLRQNNHKKPLSCDTCGKSFAFTCQLKIHVRRHTSEKPYSCDACEKSFTHESTLYNHKIIHTGEKSYSCDVCEKSFSHKGTLNKHKIIHTGKKPYFCDVCEKSFSRQRALMRHKSIHKGEKPYCCDVCGKIFLQLNYLEKHIKRIHTDKRSYSCEVCQNTFSLQSNLVRHKLIHSGEKPYSCNICGKKFTQKSTLKEHLKTVHDKEPFIAKPYSCGFCEKTFPKVQNLIQHLKRIHDKEWLKTKQDMPDLGLLIPFLIIPKLDSSIAGVVVTRPNLKSNPKDKIKKISDKPSSVRKPRSIKMSNENDALLLPTLNGNHKKSNREEHDNDYHHELKTTTKTDVKEEYLDDEMDTYYQVQDASEIALKSEVVVKEEYF